MNDDIIHNEPPAWQSPEAVAFVESLAKEKSLTDDMKDFRDMWHDPTLREEIDRRIIWPVENLLAHIDQQQATIETLKAALIDRDWQLLDECNGECGKNGVLSEDCNKCEHDYVLAQLAREYPKIFGDQP